MKRRREGAFPALLQRVVGDYGRSYLLTPREKSIVSFLFQGYSNKEIAAHCHISEQTVKDHLKHVYSKVGTHQRTALLARLMGTTPA